MKLHPLRSRHVSAKAAAAVVGVAVLGLSACGSNSLSGGPAAASPSAGASSSAAVTADDALVAKLPQKIKDAGTITVGTDASYAPNEFLDSDGKTVVGMDVDLFSAVAAKFGVKAEFQPADFSSIITGVQGGKYNVGVSSFTINADRKKQVTMVSYFSAGTQWASLKDNPKQVDPDNPCGKTIAVQTGTVQETDDLPARQAKCGGNKINILSFKGQDQATNAVVTGRADAMLADSPVTAYAVKQTSGKLASLGDVYDSAPYGYVLPKDETDFGAAVATALQELQKDGTYGQILAKWGVENGATTTFAVNPLIMATTTEAPARPAEERYGVIRAIPVRHPGRWVAIAVLAVLAAMFLNMLLFNKAFNWPFVFEAMNQTPVIAGFLQGTLLVTVLAMIFGVGLGVLLAVMRLSDNPILAGVSWLYTWFFRAIPRYVLLTIMGALGILFQEGLSLGVPFDWKIIALFGGTGDWRFATFDANKIFVGLVGGVIGLAASEAAYMAEIARAGILSVDRGQLEAAQALGMNRRRAMTRVVLPQAMRVIVPPTGNETVAMLKDTSLLLAIPVTAELFFQLQAIGTRTYQTFPVLVAATIYYLAASSVLMVGQAYLERRFGRGFGTTGRTAKQEAASALQAGAAK